MIHPILIDNNIFEDERGYFFEPYNKSRFHDLGINCNWIQDNESYSKKNVLRGLHYQTGNFSQAKLVRVIKGEIQDVIVDMRRFGPNFGQAKSYILNDKDKISLFIPRGFAHGFVTLSDEVIFNYKVDNVWSKSHETGIVFNDKDLNINWLVDKDKLIISEKDRLLPKFKEAEFFG